MKHLNALQGAKKLISFNTSLQGGISTALNWLSNWCADSGLHVQTFSNTQAILIETHPEIKKHISFVLHLDVVPADGWKEAFDPKVENGWLIGRGAVDDLGPLAVCLEVIRTAKELRDINVSCLIVTDEETENKEIETILTSGAFSPGLTIVADGGTHTTFDIGQKGIVSFTVTISTDGGHSAFEESDKSASEQMLAFIAALKNEAHKKNHHPRFSKTFLNISKIVSETVPYGLPTQSLASIELQFPLPQTSKEWIRIITSLKDSFGKTEITFHSVSEPHLVTDKKLLSLIENMPGVTCITTGGNNLAKNLSSFGISAVSHCPVSEYMAHCPNERIKISDLKKGIEMYLALIKQYQAFTPER